MKNKKRKILVWAVVAVIAVLASLAAFIKYDTEAAAEFTDNYLRPILGPTIVVSMEKFYFNLSDQVERTMYNPKADVAGVTYVDVGDTTGIDIIKTRLDLKQVPPITSLPPEPSEGKWRVRKIAAFPGEAVAAFTYVRPDQARPFAYVTLFQVDMQKMRLGSVAGKSQPGGPVGMPGPGVVPSPIITSGALVAAFDGGFQYRDGQYGMIVGSTTYLPLKNDLATLVGYTDGRLALIDYHGQNLGPGVAFVRQNCPMLVMNGQVASNDPANKKLWGRTLTSGIYTWRSGLGITKNGDLIFAVGNNLTPETLAAALQAGGAINAMQLDINPNWVRFNIFDTLGNGQYKSSTLIKELRDGSQAYLHGYSKDFFYLYKPGMTQ
jgi:hypothetical protein